MPIPTWTLPNSAAPQTRTPRNALAPLVIGLGLAGIAGGIARAADAYLPIVMPITGFLSVEGGSQRNGAVMPPQQRSAYSRPMPRRGPSPSSCSPLSASFAMDLLASPITCTAWRARTMSDRPPLGYVNGRQRAAPHGSQSRRRVSP